MKNRTKKSKSYSTNNGKKSSKSKSKTKNKKNTNKSKKRELTNQDGGRLMNNDDFKTRLIKNIKIVKDPDSLQDQIPIQPPPQPECVIL
jgi:hypothetical protein